MKSTLKLLIAVRSDQNVNAARETNQVVDDRTRHELLPARAVRVADDDFHDLVFARIRGQRLSDAEARQTLNANVKALGEGEINRAK